MWPFSRKGRVARNSKGASTSETETPAELGAKILRRYRHPESWQDGFRISMGGRAVKLLRVEEIRLGGDAFVSEGQALANSKAILAFVGSKGILPHMLTVEQQPGKAPYVVVQEQYFENHVLPILMEL